MKIDTAVVTIKNVRMVLAFPHSSWVVAGVGDQLLERLARHYPTLPGMLINFDDGEERAYASFNAAPFLADLNLDDISLVEVDLDARIEEDEPPF